MNLLLFNNTNLTTDAQLSAEMKTYYSDYLIDNAKPKLVHDQFGQKQPIPKNGGKTIEFRKYNPLPKALNPLMEGITPNGQKISVSRLQTSLEQYGGYVEMSDVLLTTAIDNNLTQVTALLGSQAGETVDTITREVINGGTNVQFAGGAKAARHLLVGGEATGNDYLNVLGVQKAVRYLKTQKATPFEGECFVAIVHPDTLFDLTRDPEWVDAAKYGAPEQLFTGEVGKIRGCRFVESTEAKVFHANNLSENARNLTINSIDATKKIVTLKEAITADDATNMLGRLVIISDGIYEITDANATSKTITLDTAVVGSSVANTVIYPGEAGAKGRDVYSTLVFGQNAYGVVELEGGGLEHIVKPLGSGGSGDPLDQRATAGWKATKAAERLVESFIIRIESASTFESGNN